MAGRGEGATLARRRSGAFGYCGKRTSRTDQNGNERGAALACALLEGVGEAEFADDLGGVAVVAIHGVVEPAHVGFGDFSREGVEDGAQFRVLCQDLGAHYGNCFVGREVVAVIFERDEIEGIDQAVGGVSGDDVNLFFFQGAVDQS